MGCQETWWITNSRSIAAGGQHVPSNAWSSWQPPPHVHDAQADMRNPCAIGVMSQSLLSQSESSGTLHSGAGSHLHEDSFPTVSVASAGNQAQPNNDGASDVTHSVGKVTWSWPMPRKLSTDYNIHAKLGFFAAHIVLPNSIQN